MHVRKCISCVTVLFITIISDGCNGFGFLAPVGIAAGLGSYLLKNTCRFTSVFGVCCDEKAIPANYDNLKKELDSRIYGQHLVQDVVVNAIKSHWDKDFKAKKALTLSFHGWPGCGKNYVTKFIVNNLYAPWAQAKYVHHFIGRIHFPRQANVQQYQEDLYHWIKTNVTECSKQLFIFDEVDKMPSQVLNAIKPIIDYHDGVDGVDYRESIFIFLSNTGASIINEHFLDLWKNSGKKREDFKLKDFESLIYKGAFNEEGWLNKEGYFNNIIRKIFYNYYLEFLYPLYNTLQWSYRSLKILGGFHHSDTIQSNLIDHYIPFLPMERRHVRSCILDEFKQRNVTNPNTEHINDVLEFVEWGPSSDKLFSVTGCKRISQKVGTIVIEYRNK